MDKSRKCMKPSKERQRSKAQKKAGSEETTLTRHATRLGAWAGKVLCSGQVKKVEKSTYPTSYPFGYNVG